MPFSVDVVDDRSLIETIANVERDFGPLDGMATIIGMAAWSPIVDTAMETWDSEQARDPPGPPTAIVLHLHGGAFRTGAPETVAPFAAALAARCKATVICPAYRLAPEHPYPAGLNDAQAVLRMLQCEAQHPLIVSGDSAGGGLAASLTSLAIAAGAPPDRLVLISPWLDLTLASNCYEENASTDPLFSRAAAQAAAELYLQGASPHDALASPLFADLSDFPPTLISVGSGEVLADDSRRFHAGLTSAGAEAVLCEIADMEHVAVTRGFALGGAAQTFAAIIAFIRLSKR